MIFGILRISGNSLHPAYKNGEYVLVSSLPLWLRGLRAGDVVVFHRPRLGQLIKIVERVVAGGVIVHGLHPLSSDSRSFGPVERSEISGMVIFHVRKR